MAGQGRGRGGEYKREKGKGATVSFLPNPPPFPLIPTPPLSHPTHKHPHALNTVDPSGT